MRRFSLASCRSMVYPVRTTSLDCVLVHAGTRFASLRTTPGDVGMGHQRCSSARVSRETRTAAMRMPPWIICTIGPARLRIVSPVPTICR